MADSIQAYFFGASFNERENGELVGLAGFSIPDLGIIYRNRQKGGVYECQYTGLLSLLEFIELNGKNFAGMTFDILTDSALIVYQIQHRKIISPGLTPLYNAAMEYKRKIDYHISWIPRNENVALIGLTDTPALKPDMDIEFLFPSGDSSASA